MTNVTPLRSPSIGISEVAFEALKHLVNHEAEQWLLGAILVNNKAWDAVCDVVSPDDFAHRVHGSIFSAMGSIIGNGGVASPVTLYSYFADDPALKQFGGGQYIAILAASAVSVLNAPFYAQTVRDLAWRRELVLAVDEISSDARSVVPDRDFLAVLDDAEQRLYEIAERGTRQGAPRPLSDAVQAAITEMEATYRRGGAIIVDTGLVDLDRIVTGMGGGDMHVLAGRPAMGKSAGAGTIAANCAKAGKRVLFFSLEMTRLELARRWIAGVTGISTEAQRHGRVESCDWARLIEAQKYLNGLPIQVDDQPRLSVNQMRQRARRMKRRTGLDLVIIDHLQLVRQGGKQESRRVEIGDVTSSLKAIAKELDVPVLLLSQINRGVESRDDKRPTLSDLKESGDIEQDADVVMFLYREEYYASRTEPKRKEFETSERYAERLADWQRNLDDIKCLAEIIVAKNRHGRTGVAKVAFNGERQRFENLAHQGQF
jgi:replicative DNA helicase